MSSAGGDVIAQIMTVIAIVTMPRSTTQTDSVSNPIIQTNGQAVAAAATSEAMRTAVAHRARGRSRRPEVIAFAGAAARDSPPE